MRNSAVILTGVFFLCAFSAARAQLGANDNLPPTAEDVVQAFSVRTFGNEDRRPSPPPVPLVFEEAPVGSEAQDFPLIPKEVPPVPEFEAPPDVPTSPLEQQPPQAEGSENSSSLREPWSDSTSPNTATVFDHSESLTHQAFSSVSGIGCGETYKPSQRCVGDETCRILSFYSGFAFMSRSDPDHGVLFANSVLPAQKIDAGDFDFGLQSGIEAGAIAHGLFTDSDLDLRFLGIGDITDSQRQSFTSSGMPISTPTQFYVVGARSAETELASSMRSFEANLRYRFGGGHRWWSLLAGFRYLAVEERQSTRLVDPSRQLATSIVRIGTANHLYGAQIGIDAPLLGNACFNIDCYGRVGLYGNDSSSSTNFRSGIPGGAVLDTSRQGGVASMAGELGVKATCRLSRAWNLYGRYQVLFIDDLALASQQLNSQHTAHGEVAFQGGTFGLEYVY